MPDIRPFRGWRYDLGRVGALSDVIAPPYDVIDPSLREALYSRSPYNVVRVDFGKDEPADNPHANRYTRAARTLKDWQRDGILRQENDPALYVYHQTFRIEASGGREATEVFTRRGVLARVRLEPFGQGKTYPHEETMPGPKADRLKLMQATAMNLSPVFGLYPDSLNEIQNRLDEAVKRVLPMEASDHLGTVSRLWPVTNIELIRDVQSLFFDKPVFIADGHHRYETALKYRDELKVAGEFRDDEHPANFTLMMLVGMSDPGLLILPTHRLVGGIPALIAAELRALLGEHFEMETIGQGPGAARDAWELIEASGEQSLLGFGTVADDTWQTARFRAPAEMNRLASAHSLAWQGLGVSILHVLVLDRLLKEKTGEPTCRFVHLLREVTQAVAANECRLAVLVPPATMEHVEQIAGNLEKMPPKSTYFYPKLLSGLVFNPLK
jgi:uncharacterized protein (DUF1015 family)